MKVFYSASAIHFDWEYPFMEWLHIGEELFIEINTVVFGGVTDGFITLPHIYTDDDGVFGKVVTHEGGGFAQPCTQFQNDFWFYRFDVFVE
jgi:hypothetical protein